MIKTFKDTETQLIFKQQRSKKMPFEVQKTALRKLMIINAASDLNDLKIPPGNRLEPLTGDRLGQFSIRINDQYRICFAFKDGNFYDVEIIDYH